MAGRWLAGGEQVVSRWLAGAAVGMSSGRTCIWHRPDTGRRPRAEPGAWVAKRGGIGDFGQAQERKPQSRLSSAAARRGRSSRARVGPPRASGWVSGAAGPHRAAVRLGLWLLGHAGWAAALDREGRPQPCACSRQPYACRRQPYFPTAPATRCVVEVRLDRAAPPQRVVEVTAGGEREAAEEHADEAVHARPVL